MGKEFWIGLGVAIISLAFGVAITVLVVVEMITKENAYIWLIIAGLLLLLGISIIIWSLCFKKKKDDTADQIYQKEMGRHIKKIESVLNTLEKQLLSWVKSNKSEWLKPTIEKTDAFTYMLRHCPTIDKEYAGFYVCRGRYEDELKRLKLLKIVNRKDNEVEKKIRENRERLVRKIDEMIVLIKKSLSSHEYQKKHCFWCPKNLTEV